MRRRLLALFSATILVTGGAPMKPQDAHSDSELAGIREEASAHDLTGFARQPAESENLRLIRQFHDAGTSIQKLRDSGLLAEEVEWWVAGPKEVLPFAGTWRGHAAVAEFHRLLGETVRYDQTVVKKYLVDGDDVAAIFLGSGIARLTGRSFESEILRLYTLQQGRIVRVRNYYDTAAYVRAVQ